METGGQRSDLYASCPLRGSVIGTEFGGLE